MAEPPGPSDGREGKGESGWKGKYEGYKGKGWGKGKGGLDGKGSEKGFEASYKGKCLAEGKGFDGTWEMGLWKGKLAHKGKVLEKGKSVEDVWAKGFEKGKPVSEDYKGKGWDWGKGWGKGWGKNSVSPTEEDKRVTQAPDSRSPCAPIDNFATVYLN